jgi:hypothetical protein
MINMELRNSGREMQNQSVNWVESNAKEEDDLSAETVYLDAKSESSRFSQSRPTLLQPNFS